MAGSIFKYVQDGGGAGSRHQGGKLHWPAANHFGVPMRGNVTPFLNEDEMLDKTSTVSDFYVKEFDLSDPEQLSWYVDVMDHIVNGWYLKIFIERRWDEVLKKRFVYLEWTQRYAQVNDAGEPKLNLNVG